MKRWISRVPISVHTSRVRAKERHVPQSETRFIQEEQYTNHTVYNRVSTNRPALLHFARDDFLPFFRMQEFVVLLLDLPFGWWGLDWV